MQISDRILNRLNVLKAIRRWEPVSRTKLAEITGLSGGLITQLTADLLARKLIVERRDLAKRNGRPRLNLEINAEGAIVIGASQIGNGKLSTSFVDLSGNLLFSRDMALPNVTNLAELALATASALDEAITESPFALSQIHRVGILLAAVVDARKGIVHFMTTLPPGPEQFAQKIAEVLNLPVSIENEMTAMARAEHWFGRAIKYDSFTIINVGYSLGSARYLDGLPCTGANGISAEIGHTKVEFGSHARPCYCGARGCTSMYTSMYGILQADGSLEQFSFQEVERLDGMFQQLLARADGGEAKAISLLNQAGEKLGITVANHINAADPGEVLILLPDDRMRRFISEQFESSLAENVLPGLQANTGITFDVANPNWSQKGFASLALEQTFLTTEKLL